MDIVNEVLLGMDWSSVLFDIKLSSVATCAVEGSQTASIYLGIAQAGQDKLSKLQEEIEVAIIAKGVRLKRRRNQQQQFHLTLAHVLEDDYNMHRGLLHLNKWLDERPGWNEGVTLQLKSVCWHGHESSAGTRKPKCLGSDQVVTFRRARRLGTLPEAVGYSKFLSSWVSLLTISVDYCMRFAQYRLMIGGS
eukprot:TRINITY_DN11382_c0_g3_i11.p1 TRINITY_DN11382_c0_g3~~TRINITY_DN11382_c0_g3_i11.p1  ORF type:complete len:192 (+),score=25.22 TRINITY_DN11382_c0_g3_i11:399-974(+)